MNMPEISELIQAGIRDRHDIVHRNGKSPDGQERSWDQDQIKALNQAVQLFVAEVEDLLRRLPADPDAPQ
jgi:hypothetical protein